MYKKPTVFGSKSIADGSVRTANVFYDRNNTGKIAEAIVYVTFPERDYTVSGVSLGIDPLMAVQHPLGRIPKMWSVVGSGIDTDPNANISVASCGVAAGSHVLSNATPGAFAGVHRGDQISDSPATWFNAGTYVVDVSLDGTTITMNQPAINTGSGTVTAIFTEGAARAPGQIYTDNPEPFTASSVAFRCTVPYTWAKIALR